MRTGQLELKLGTDAALERAEDWVERAEKWLKHEEASSWDDSVSVSGGSAKVRYTSWLREFTSDDLRGEIGDPPGHGDALGAVLRAWQSQHRIVAVGRRRSSRPDAHGRGITVWRIA